VARNSFIIKKDFYLAIEGLSDLQLGKLFRAIFEYQCNQSDCKDHEIKMAFFFFKAQFDVDDWKYSEKVGTNKMNGSKGGRPNERKKANAKKKTQIPPSVILNPKKAEDDCMSDEDENERMKDNFLSTEAGFSSSDSEKILSGNDFTYKKSIDKYFEFYKSRNAVSPPMNATGGKAMKKMISYFRSIVIHNHKDFEELEIRNEIVNCFEYLFSNYARWQPYHQKQLKLEQIESNLSNIIDTIKNGKKQDNFKGDSMVGAAFAHGG